jgi:hypothetical protein
VGAIQVVADLELERVGDVPLVPLQ